MENVGVIIHLENMDNLMKETVTHLVMLTNPILVEEDGETVSMKLVFK